MIKVNNKENRTTQFPYADENGIYELTDDEAALYEILEGDYKNDEEENW